MADNVSTQFNKPAIAFVTRHYIVSFISGLLSARSPSAVIRLIVAIIVDTIQRVSIRGAWPHVGIKVGKASQPPITNSDATSAIIVKTFMPRTTPGLHVQPSIIFRSVCHLMGAANRASKFFLQTAATAMFTAHQVGGLCKRFITAIAQTSPNNFFTTSAISFNNRQSVKAFIG